MRVYLPSTLGRLRALALGTALGPAPLRAHAVTDALRAAQRDGDDEEWEYVALTAAARDAVGLLGDADPARRVVVAADVSSVRLVPGQQPTAVEVTAPVPLRHVAAVHVDSQDAEAAVRQARLVWRDAEGGDERAQEVLDRCQEQELGWYATQEIGDLASWG